MDVFVEELGMGALIFVVGRYLIQAAFNRGSFICFDTFNCMVRRAAYV